MPESNTNISRDHLFLSYAGEDGAFAEWLTLRLTGEGYRVWCDRIKLLGGESYPIDIDDAIKNQTFRVLAVLSRSSVHKPNPLKERTLALNIARQRQEEFIIPLNLDGIEPTQIDWMMSDITFVPFNPSWAEGFAKLLKLLDSINAPKPLSNGRQIVCDWVTAQDFIKNDPERLWTNVLDVKELPETLIRVSVKRGSISQAFHGWPYYRENDQVVWVFEMPPMTASLEQADVQTVHWMETLRGSKLSLRNVRINLLRQYVHLYCLKKGLTEVQDHRGRRHLHFSLANTANGWLSFSSYTGATTRLRAVGERRFWTGPDQRETVRYHLSPSFSAHLDVLEEPIVSIRLQVYLTDENGRPLPVRKSITRRKAICKRWWNHEWLTRLLAVTQWFNQGESEINLALTDECRIAMSGTLRTTHVPLGIDEERLNPIDESEDGDLVDTAEVDDADGDEHI